jgi:thiol-disulfide isomerase/thioredoxin
MAFATLSAAADPPFTSGNFKTVCAAARTTHRIVLIDFYTTWCGPCKMLDRNTWSNARVRAWLGKNTVCLKLDAEKQTALASRYKIEAYPTVMLLTPDGTEIDRLVGYREPATFLADAKDALAGHDSIARAKTRLKGAAMNDPSQRMDYAQALEEKGQYADALKEYLWCLDKGNQHDAIFSGVRLSFLLDDIMQLGSHFPPAIEALKTRRDTARATLEQGAGGTDVAEDFSSYNEYLGQQEQTLEVYDRLKGTHPALADLLISEIADQLVEKRRYTDLVSAVGDAPPQVDQALEIYHETVLRHRSDAGLIDYMKQKTVETCGCYFEALVGAGKYAEADKLRDKLLAIGHEPAAYEALIMHAARAGKPEVIKQLLALAQQKLSAQDFLTVQQAAK